MDSMSAVRAALKELILPELDKIKGKKYSNKSNPGINK